MRRYLSFTLGLFSLCGRQVSLLVITALLTIIGYSVNDTIVVFDRIREDLRRDQKSPFKDLCNRALNECLSRTVITSITTFFAVLALFAFGDGSIFDFALTMLIGVIAGTYSSVFIATPIQPSHPLASPSPSVLNLSQHQGLFQ